MKIIVMYINVLIMIVRMLKMIVLNVEDDSIENSVCWGFDEASEYKGWVIKLDLTTPVKF